MQRIDASESGSHLACRFAEIPQCREITERRKLLSAQGIEMRCETEDLASLRECRREEAFALFYGWLGDHAQALEALGHIAGGGRGKPHRREKRALGRDRDLKSLALHRPPDGLDAGRIGELMEEPVIGRGAAFCLYLFDEGHDTARRHFAIVLIAECRPPASAFTRFRKS